MSPHPRFDWFTADFAVDRGVVLDDIGDVWRRKYAGLMTGGVTYVHGTYGSDAVGTGTSWAHAFKSIDKALRETASGEVHVWPGTYASSGYRATDAQGDRPKMLIAPFGGVTITTTGDRLGDLVWLANATYPTVYEARLVTANHVIRLRLGDVHLPRRNNVKDVSDAGFGWWYDAASRTLFVRLQDLPAIKAELSAVYAAGGDNSLVVKSRLYLEGIALELYPFVLPSSVPSEVWLKNCELRYSEAAAVQVNGGRAYAQGCKLHQSKGDLFNYDGDSPCGAELYCTGFDAGDPDTFGRGAGQPTNALSIAQNKNASSAHTGSVVRVGARYAKTFGPVVADTDTSYSWHIGCEYGGSLASGSSRFGAIVQGNTARAWMDGCTVMDGGIAADNGAVIAIRDSRGRRVATGGTFVDYEG